MSSNVEIYPALEFSLEDLADLLNRCFEGYFVTIHDTPELLAQRLRIDSIDLALSQVAVIAGDAAGLIYLAPRGWNCRVAGMGVAPKYRRRGLGRQLMESSIDLACRRRFHAMILEVIEQNAPALTLYRQLGFISRRRLLGYQLDTTAVEVESSDILQPVDPRQVADLVAIEGERDLPWQLAPESIAAFSAPTHAFALAETAYALLSYIDGSSAVIQTLLVRRNARRQGWGRRLVAALQHKFPGRIWKISARVPEDLADDFLLRLGFEHMEWTQLEMALEL